MLAQCKSLQSISQDACPLPAHHHAKHVLFILRRQDKNNMCMVTELYGDIALQQVCALQYVMHALVKKPETLFKLGKTGNLLVHVTKSFNRHANTVFCIQLSLSYQNILVGINWAKGKCRQDIIPRGSVALEFRATISLTVTLKVREKYDC